MKVNIKQAIYSVVLSCCLLVFCADKLFAQVLYNPGPHSNYVGFQWTAASGAQYYQFQLLRLYNIDSTKHSTPGNITAVIDWSQALTLEVSSTSLPQLSVKEGRGYYAWRVRAVKSTYPGGHADDRNCDPWTAPSSLNDGNVLPVSSAALPNIFYYNTAADNDYNWIFNRKFIESDNVVGSSSSTNQSITYANFLLQPIQTQSSTPTGQMRSETFYDYSGRPALSTLPNYIPSLPYFGYASNSTLNTSGQKYSAKDFDKPNNSTLPRGISASYYSNSNPDLQVPVADTFAFSRTLYQNDGLNRETEIASPGKQYSFGGHTVKKYYCAPTDAELVRIFGDEAPKATSIEKQYTIDPNGVYNVSYINEQGKVIATCLSARPSKLLDTIPYTSFYARDTIRDKMVGTPGYSLVMTTTKTFALPTELSYVYKILPNVYKDECLELCNKCDYRAILTARSREDTTVEKMHIDSLVVHPSFNDSLNCTTTSQQITGSYSINNSTILEPGTYDISLALILDNTNYNTGRRYIDSAVNIMHAALDSAIFGVGKKVKVIGGNPDATMYAIDTFLNKSDINGLLGYLQADTTDTAYFSLVVGPCDTIQLPTENCGTYNCTAPSGFGNYMANYLYNFDNDYYALFYTNQDISKTTDSAHYLYWVADNAAFDNVIANMVADGYNCDSLWMAWQLTVQSYAVAQMGADKAVGNMTFTSGSRKVDWWGDFMDRVKYRKAITRQDWLKGTSAATHPYKVIKYKENQNLDAQKAFMEAYRISVGGSSGTSYPFTTWFNALKNLPTYNYRDTAHSYHILNFYFVAKPVANAFKDLANDLGVINLANAYNPAQLIKQIEFECYKACESKKDAAFDNVRNYASSFTSTLLPDSVGIPMEAHPPTYPVWSGSTQNMLDVNLIDRSAEVMIAACKIGCIVDSATQVPSYNPDIGLGGTKYYHSPNKELFKRAMVYDMQLKSVNWHYTSVPPIAAYYPFSLGGNEYLWEASGTPALGGEKHRAMQTLYNTSFTYNDNTFVPALKARGRSWEYWLKREYRRVRDSLAQQGVVIASDTFIYQPSLLHNCPPRLGSTVYNPAIPIIMSDKEAWFSWGIDATDAAVMTGHGLIFQRIRTDSLAVETNYEVKLRAIVTTALGVNDSIEIVEAIPLIVCTSCTGTPQPSSRATIHATQGSISGTSMRFKAYGPHSVGDTIEFKYIFETPRSSMTVWKPWDTNKRNEYSITYGGGLLKYTSGSAVGSVTLSAANKPLGDSVSFFYNRVDSNGLIVNHRICSRMDVLMPFLAGNEIQREFDLVYEWVDPNAMPEGDTLYALTCGNVLGSSFRNALNQKIDEVHEKHENQLRQQYEEKCKTPELINDFLENANELSQYSYTLYYYDRAGNLIRTVSPKGVKETTTDRSVNPYHDFVSSYDYSIYGSVIKQITPDGGTTDFVYDKLNRLRFSRNTLQDGQDKFSYVKYDSLSRVIETGEAIYADTSIFRPDSTESKTFPMQGFPSTLTYVTKTVYSEPYSTGPFPPCDLATKQTFLHNRISYTTTDVDGDWNTTHDETYTLYGYDAHGNVRSLVQWASGMAQPKYMEYTYDLIGGNVKSLHYYSLVDNGGTTYTVQNSDKYSQRYGYDAWNRLVRVATTLDVTTTSLTGVNDAYYTYYNHGPLKRMALNDYSSGVGATQGVDYTYTLQGWLKGINSVEKTWPISDTGGGGIFITGKDVFGEIINYNYDDFSKTGSSFNSTAYERLKNDSLFNGNIVSVEDKIYSHDASVDIKFEDGAGFKYRYDQLNRITGSKFYKWNNADPDDPHWDYDSTYNENFTYDANGNITTLHRYGPHPTVPNTRTIWDSLSYNYFSTDNNWLSGVHEAAGVIDNDIPAGTNSFGYDIKGRVTLDGGNKLMIYWRPDDRVEKIERFILVMVDGKRVRVPQMQWQYLYDAMGNRVKTVETDLTTSATDVTYNVFNAGGNMMATYPSSNAYSVSERYIYGTERLGLIAGGNSGTLSAGNKKYEIHDHLGNVRVVINGARDVNNQAVVSRYFNYYAFGSPQPGRHHNGLQHQFGFNGQKKVDELKGMGNHNTALFWEYDTRLGRRWNIDPVDQVGVSNYATFENNPIWKNDLLGNVPNEYEVDKKAGTVKQTGTKGGDDVDYITVKNDPGVKVGDLQIKEPAPDKTYTVPVVTKMFGTGFDQYFSSRGPGEIVIGSSIAPVDGPIQSFCYECIFLPLPKGLQLFGRGTGIIGSTAKTSRILGGASKTINYYSKAAETAGYSTTLTGARVKAGLFVQVSHNVRNLATGRSLKILASNSEATIIGRSWQNQAIGLGTLNIGFSVGAAHYNLSPSNDNNHNGIGFGR